MTTSLNELVNTRAETTERFDEQELLRIWREVADDLGLNPQLGEEAILTTARDVTALACNQIEPAFGGAWVWDLSDNVVKTALIGVLLTGVMSACGVRELTPIVMPTILPLLFDFKRVRLEGKGERIVKIFGVRAEAFERTGSRQSLYALLPETERQFVSFDEFSNFIDDAVAAGVAIEDGNVIEILPNGETVMRLRVR